MSSAYGDALEERNVLAQAIWDARKALGLDNDGDPTPAAAIAGRSYRAFADDFIVDCKQVAADHDAALDEIPDVTLAKGVWCPTCEFFEGPDWNGDNCQACGCARVEHVVASVVTS